jgi:hypothetical protein
MFWRLVSALILIFWLVMTTKLVRQTYFPAEAQLAAISPLAVFQQFEEHRSMVNTLLLTRDAAGKYGQGTFNIRSWTPAGAPGPRGYTLEAGGMMDGKAWGDSLGGTISWRFDGDVDRELHWERLDLRVRVASTDTTVVFSWKIGDEQPKLEVLKAGQPILDLDSALEQGSAAQGLPGFSSMAMLPGMKSAATLGSLIQLTANDGRMDLAGSPRRCQVVTFAVFGLYQAKAFFTEAGELARIDLPQGYQFIDPLLSGLAQ